MNLKWDDHYPDQTILRNEIGCMVDSYIDVLFQIIPKNEISGIYLKGSAQKEWESPLDYVPELSDIDIHLLLSSVALIEKYFGALDQTLDIQHRVEKIFSSKVIKRIHIPRPQLLILNTLLTDENFIPSPRNAITLLYGRDYPESDYSNHDKIRYFDCKQLLKRGEILSTFPMQVVDKPFKYLWSALRQLSWRVSPVGPSVLNILGLEPETAWSLNRTKIARKLRDLEEDKLAEDYSKFYLFGWDFFLSGYSDGNAARSALIFGEKVVRRGLEIAESWLARHPK